MMKITVKGRRDIPGGFYFCTIGKKTQAFKRAAVERLFASLRMAE